MLRKLFVAACIVLVVGGGLLAVAAIQLRRHSAAADTTLVVGSGSGATKTYKLETVTTDADQKQGLSGRSGLPKDGGMHFAYGGVAERCIWMKDMKFTIDVIWVNADGRIVSAVPNMKPESYPQKYCANAKSVIELPAGTIKQQGLRPGQTVQL